MSGHVTIIQYMVMIWESCCELELYIYKCVCVCVYLSSAQSLSLLAFVYHKRGKEFEPALARDTRFAYIYI